MCFLVCVDGVGSLPEGSGASHPTERAGKSKRLQEPDVNRSCSLPAVTSRAHHSFREVGKCHYMIHSAIFCMNGLLCLLYTEHLVLSFSYVVVQCENMY